MDPQLKERLGEVRDALHKSLSASEPLAGVVSRLKKGGYDVGLIFNVSIKNDHKKQFGTTSTKASVIFPTVPTSEVDQIKELIKELDQALNESLSGSELIAGIVSRIKESGYEIDLLLQAQIVKQGEKTAGEAILDTGRKALQNLHSARKRKGSPLRAFLIGIIVGVALRMVRPEHFYPWGFVMFIVYFVSWWNPWLKFRSDIRRWAEPLRGTLTAGALCNLAVIVANDGYMPVVGLSNPHGVWKAAAATDHLLFLCDRFQLLGPHSVIGPTVANIGGMLIDWSVTSNWWVTDSIGYFLMGGSAIASIGDFLIYGSLLAWTIMLVIVSRASSRTRRALNYQSRLMTQQEFLKPHAAFWNAKMREAEENAWRLGPRPKRATVSELISYVNTPRDVLAFKKNPDAFLESKRAIRRSRWPRLRAWWEAFLHRHIIDDGPI